MAIPGHKPRIFSTISDTGNADKRHGAYRRASHCRCGKQKGGGPDCSGSLARLESCGTGAGGWHQGCSRRDAKGRGRGANQRHRRGEARPTFQQEARPPRISSHTTRQTISSQCFHPENEISVGWRKSPGPGSIAKTNSGPRGAPWSRLTANGPSDVGTDPKPKPQILVEPLSQEQPILSRIELLAPERAQFLGELERLPW
jgi:hypothetical protein